MSIKSFDDFASNKPAVPKPTRRVVSKPVQKIQEAAILVENSYRVKTVVDVPKEIVDAYCKKVESETGKSALFMFSHEELAEEMVKYLVKNIKAESIPSSLSVGEESEVEDTTPPAVTDKDPFDDNNDVETEIELEDEPAESSETKPMPMKKGTSAIDFEGDEVELGEKDNIELDTKQPIK